MIEIKAIDLVTYNSEQLSTNFTRAKRGKLYKKNLVVAEGKKISELYVNSLEFFFNNGVDIVTVLNGTCNETGEKINPKSQMKIIRNTNIYVDTTNNSFNKFVKIKRCFEYLSDDLNQYRFEIDVDEKNTNELSKEGLQKIESDNKPFDNFIEKSVKSNKQIIFTGAPGTGKTWSVRNIVKKLTNEFEEYKFIQFHSSYDYTDFVEGLRPVPDINGSNMFVRMDGTFKAFCRNIVNDNLKRLKKYNNEISDIDSYFQFMLNSSDKNKIYEFLDKKTYYFIIDEINRADLSRVFGELMFGLEESYREVDNRFDTQYKNLLTYEMKNGEAMPIKDDVFKDGFFIPYNLHIIGTMNDIDRSVESFDFALRRRFTWIDIKANDVMFESLKSIRDEKNAEISDEKLESVVEKIKYMNEKMTQSVYGLSDAYHIGPAYFQELVKVSDSDDEIKNKLNEIFTHKIESILREYTRGRRSDVETELIKLCKDALGIKENAQR